MHAGNAGPFQSLSIALVESHGIEVLKISFKVSLNDLNKFNRPGAREH